MARAQAGKASSRRGKTRDLAQPVRESVPQAVGELPAGYPALLEDLKARIRATQVKAALSVNRELIQLYWGIGRDIVRRQQAEGWGKSIVERLADDLQAEFPGIAGLSSRNIWRMRAFHLAWPEPRSSLPQLVADPRGPVLPQPVADIPWGHNVVLMEKLKDPAQRLWYAEQTVANGWSRSMLVHWIESGLYERRGKAVNNFKATLPASQSDLASELLKDPYNRGMNFYLSAVDDLLRHPDDKPSIGLILCKSRSCTVAEYALRDLAKPVGVARYVTRLVESLPPNLRTALPSVRQLEQELNKARNDGVSDG